MVGPNVSILITVYFSFGRLAYWFSEVTVSFTVLIFSLDDVPCSVTWSKVAV